MSGESFWKEYSEAVTWFDRNAFIAFRNDETGQQATLLLLVYRDRMASDPDTYYLDGILVEADARRAGFGTVALKWLTSLADKHGVTLTLNAHPFGVGKRATKATLMRWYRKHGWEHQDPKHYGIGSSKKKSGYMKRTPR